VRRPLPGGVRLYKVRIKRRPLIRYWIPVVVMIGFIAVESTDGFSSAHTASMLGTLLAYFGVPPERIPEINHILRKTGHCVGYGFLGFLIFRAFRGTYRFFSQGYEGWISSRVTQTSGDIFALLWQPYWAVAAMIGTFVVAACDEVHQMSIPSRTGTWWDVVLDTSAALVVQVIVYWIDRAKADRIIAQRTTR
jgi:VanZ family protein